MGGGWDWKDGWDGVDRFYWRCRGDVGLSTIKTLTNKAHAPLAPLPVRQQVRVGVQRAVCVFVSCGMVFGGYV